MKKMREGDGSVIGCDAKDLPSSPFLHANTSEGPDWLPKMKLAIQCTFLFTACPLMVTE